MDFLNRHLSVTAKTMVNSVKDFDEADSKLIKVYGKPLTIVQGTLIEADENITPVWHRLQARLDRSKPNQSVGIVSVGEKILVLETVLLLMNKLTDISERGDDFKKLFF